MRKLFLALLVGALTSISVRAQTLYVATNGDDHWSGRLPYANDQRTDGPLYSLPAAVEKSRHIRHHDAENPQILLRGGTYSLDKTFVLKGEDSGLTIAAYRHETPVISGQTVIRGWRRSNVNPNIWQTEIEGARNGKWIFHELFVNGQRKQRTRIPYQGYFHMAGAGVTNHPNELRFHPGDINPEWAWPGDVELVAYSAWAQTRNQIRKVSEPFGIVSLAGKALANTAEPNGRFYIENAPVPLRPGQWHIDAHTGLLTYWPDAGENISHAMITAPHLYDLIKIDGHVYHQAHDITFRGITFADADWQLKDGSDIDGQAAAEMPGAVRAQFARNCTFERCVFERLGGYALELGIGCQQNKIIGNKMYDLGAGGIRVGEKNSDEAFSWPCGQNLMTDNHIHDIGLVNAPGVGIFVLASGQNEIAHNEVDHTYYTAISVGWTWGYARNPCRDNIVEFNDLHDIGQGMLSDMGGVYTLGVQPGAVVRNNLIHDINIFNYGGWGLYTDEGSSEILLENNVVYGCQSAGLHQHYGRNNVIRNNIFAFNKEAELARTRVEHYVAFIFTNNIVYFDTGRLFSGNWGDDLQMDDNIYFDTRSREGDHQTQQALQAWQKRGHDLHSLFIDPLFVAPGRDDFRLRPNSPALRLGFRQIDLKNVGVRPQYQGP
jgi:parallel beta-helix repeat protein